MSTDTVFSVGSEDCRFVCCILPTAFVTVLSWVERKWNVSVIRRVFWQALVAAESLPMSLRLYGAVVLLASPSSCDAERAISTLNRIVTPLRNRMSWPMIRLHLIGAEDVDPDGYPYELVAQSWGTTAHRRRRSSQNVRKPRKDKGKERTRERVLPETAEYVDNLGQVSDSGSSLSSFASASALTVSDEESGTDSDSDSE